MYTYPLPGASDERRGPGRGMSRGRGGRGDGSGRSMHPQRAAFEGFLRVDHPGITTEFSAHKFIAALQNQVVFRRARGGIQEVFWELVKPAAASRDRPHMHSPLPPLYGIQSAVQGTSGTSGSSESSRVIAATNALDAVRLHDANGSSYSGQLQGDHGPGEDLRGRIRLHVDALPPPSSNATASRPGGVADELHHQAAEDVEALEVAAEKAPGLQRLEEVLRVAASGDHDGSGRDSGVTRLVLPLLEALLGGHGQQLVQDRAVAEVLMQVRFCSASRM